MIDPETSRKIQNELSEVAKARILQRVEEDEVTDCLKCQRRERMWKLILFWVYVAGTFVAFVNNRVNPSWWSGFGIFTTTSAAWSMGIELWGA